MISIAMATYNGEKYIREQLDSILNQTFHEFELIICDDCSVDNTWEIISEYENNDDRIHCYRNAENIGYVKNFEKAIMLCTGDYIALSDQDDIWVSNHLEVLYRDINDAYLICSNALLVDKDGFSLEKTMHDILNLDNLNLTERETFFFLLYNNFVQGASSLFKRKLTEYIYPFPDNVIYHDYWIALNAMVMDKINYTKVVTLKYRQHEESVTKTKKKNYKNFLENIKTRKNRKYLLLLSLKERHKSLDNEKNNLLDEALKFYKSREYRIFPVYAFIFLIKHYKKIYCQRNYRFIFGRLIKMFIEKIYLKH
jgi:glycosyltransferase involved in cell wall biosynthesis